MNARILTAATLFTVFAGALTAGAADSQLLSLVMPDAKVLAGVNVDQAKASPFGLYVLSQMQTQEVQQLKALTGFDPSQDVHELLFAAGAPTGQKQTGLVLARGRFDVAKIAAVAVLKGAITEGYGGVTIVEDPKRQVGVAFPDPTLAIAGDLANVKAAIDRPHSGQSLPVSLTVMVDRWSLKEDVWVVSAVPPSSLQPPAAAGALPGGAQNMQAMFAKILSAAGGVKFGSAVVVTGQAEADNAQDAASMGDTLKLLANLALMQASQKDPQAAALLQSLTVTTQGTLLNVSVTLPMDTLQQMIKAKTAPASGPATRIMPPKTPRVPAPKQ